MIKLYLAANSTTPSELIGTISEEQLKSLVDHLEEEYAEDQDYAITSMTIEYLDSQGASPDLIELLRSALGAQEEVLIRWSKT